MKSLLFAIVLVMSTQIFAAEEGPQFSAESENNESLSSEAKKNLEIKAEDAKKSSWNRQDKSLRS